MDFSFLLIRRLLRQNVLFLDWLRLGCFCFCLLGSILRLAVFSVVLLLCLILKPDVTRSFKIGESVAPQWEYFPDFFFGILSCRQNILGKLSKDEKLLNRS